MTAILKFLDFLGVDFLEHLSKEEREKIERNAAAAAERMKARGDSVTEVQDIRRRRALEKEPA